MRPILPGILVGVLYYPVAQLTVQNMREVFNLQRTVPVWSFSLQHKPGFLPLPTAKQDSVASWDGRLVAFHKSPAGTCTESWFEFYENYVKSLKAEGELR